MSVVDLGPFPAAWIREPRYANREFSWLQFNSRVLAEAENPRNPLLERFKFLAIFESNLDEFYMVRVSGLFEQAASGLGEITPDGLTPEDQLALIAEVASVARQNANRLWNATLRPELEKAGIEIVKPASLPKASREWLSEYFKRTVFPLCTPLMLEPAITFPFISNRSLNLAVELKDGAGRKLARVKVPPVTKRVIAVPDQPGKLVLLEDLIEAHLSSLFPGVKVTGAHLFRVLRDADVEIRELEAADLISAVEASLRLRRFGDPVLLELQPSMSQQWQELLQQRLELDESDVFRVDGMLGYEALMEVAALDRPDLKFPPHAPYMTPTLSDSTSLFAAIRKADVLVHHPFDSFASVEQFVASAAEDPAVIGIKQTLYRVGAHSPVVESLLLAAERGKQVAAVVELKARFDESNNLVWSRALERAGVHVTYGIPEMKVHCKLCLVVRNEPDGIRTYAHIGTGNYNPITARIYTDLGLFTDNPDICQDVSELFNYLTGLSRHSGYRELLVAPLNLREAIIEHIEREADIHRESGGGHIVFKLNSLVDPEVIDALYDASAAGVTVDLIVRGICCLRPGVPDVSENIRVVSVVGRFLEHSRVYWFRNGGRPEAFIGSADMMRRNLDRRVEALVPVYEPSHLDYLRDVVLAEYLHDNCQAWDLSPDGSYRRREPGKSGRSEAQRRLMTLPASSLIEK